MSEIVKASVMERVWGVEPVPNELDTFTVQSKSENGVHYKVDLMAYSFNGSCTCPRFIDFGIATRLDKGEKPSHKTVCEHILRARHYFCLRALQYDKAAYEQWARQHGKAVKEEKPLF